MILIHIFGLWLVYRGAMMLKAQAAELKTRGGWRLYSAYLYLVIAYMLDFLYNAFYGTLLQLGVGTLTFSATLNRIRKNPQAFFTWQLRIADYFCEELLNPHDPSGRHC